MNRGFTLVEVLVSVVIIFAIGTTLTQISSQNVNVLQSVKKDLISYNSVVLNSTHSYRSLNDFLKIQNIPSIDAKVSKRDKDVGSFPLVTAKGLRVNYGVSKNIIKIKEETSGYFRLK